VPQVLVPDNLKSAVTKPCFYDPEINRSYKDLADHYDTVVIPARVRRPKDKSKVENAVQQVERWVLAPLRNQKFFSLRELNDAIVQRLDWLNNRPLSKPNRSRLQLFEEVDKPALKALPAKRFEIPQWKREVGVNIDYHIEFEDHYYSVPCSLIRKRVDIRATSTTVECLHQGTRVALHARSYARGKSTTIPEHRPKTHRDYADWTPSRMLRWAASIGPQTEAAVRSVMDSKRRPEEGYRAALGIIRLAARYGKERLELACERALAIRSASYKTIHSILKTGMDQRPLLQPSTPNPTPLDHENVRGAVYYN
jgi:transposase